jgi:hypothetical protein
MDANKAATQLVIDGDYIRRLNPEQKSVRDGRGRWTQVSVMVPGGIPVARLITKDDDYREFIVSAINEYEELKRKADLLNELATVLQTLRRSPGMNFIERDALIDAALLNAGVQA